MNLKASKVWFRQGVTLIEILVSIVALAVAVIGTSYFRYYSALDARKANIQTASTRIGLLLCESWKGVKGTEAYDPVVHLGSELAIAEDTTIDFSSGHPITGPLVDENFTELGIYAVVIDDITFYAVLSWKDISAELRALNVVIAWEPRGREVTGSTDLSELKLFKLTTYTSN